MSRTFRFDRQPWAGRVTFMIAIIGTAIAVIGVAMTRSDQAEQRRISLSAIVQANARDYTNEGFGLRVAFVNSSLRAISVRKAWLTLNGKRVGAAGAYLADPRVLDRFAIEPEKVTDNRLELPLTVGARQDRHLVLLFPEIRNPDDPFGFSFSAADLKGLPARFARQLRLAQEFARYAGMNNKKHDAVRLHVQLDPRASRVYRVERLPGMTPRFEWQGSLLGGRRVNAIEIRRKLGASGQSDLLRLDVWSETGPVYHRSVVRPILGEDSTVFRLGAMPDGRFVYAFRLGSRVVRAGRFRNPEPCTRSGYHPELFPQIETLANSKKQLRQLRRSFGLPPNC